MPMSTGPRDVPSIVPPSLWIPVTTWVVKWIGSSVREGSSPP